MANGAGGRKGKYHTHVEPYLDLIRSMRVDGHKEEDIAEHLGVAPSTWYDYKNKHPELTEALKYSKETLVARLEQTLFQKALEGNMTAIIFSLKNLRPDKWGEKVDVNANVTTKEFHDAINRFVEKL